MAEYKKNHYIPRFILKNFVNEDGKTHFFHKKSNKIIDIENWEDQCQKNYFYSKKTLKELDEEFSHISINPIFVNIDKNLEHNFDLYVERKFSSIVKKILEYVSKKKIPNLDHDEKTFIKEYFILQHIRTLKFKSDMKEINEEIMKLPRDFDKLILEESKKNNFLTDDRIKEIIKENNPNSNSKSRRNIFTGMKKKIRKNPLLIEKIREDWYKSNRCQDEVNKQKKIYEQKMEELRNHIDLHSANIIDKKNRDSFFEIGDLENKQIQYLYDEKNGFILPDTGILLSSLEFKVVETNEIISKEYIFYLQIHPEVVIKISYDKEDLIVVDEEFVKTHNRLCRDECLNNVYSSNKVFLKD